MYDIKQCPFCAEDIKAAAIVCKHCGRELPEYSEPPNTINTTNLSYRVKKADDVPNSPVTDYLASVGGVLVNYFGGMFIFETFLKLNTEGSFGFIWFSICFAVYWTYWRKRRVTLSDEEKKYEDDLVNNQRGW